MFPQQPSPISGRSQVCLGESSRHPSKTDHMPSSPPSHEPSSRSKESLLKSCSYLSCFSRKWESSPSPSERVSPSRIFPRRSMSVSLNPFPPHKSFPTIGVPLCLLELCCSPPFSKNPFCALYHLRSSMLSPSINAHCLLPPSAREAAPTGVLLKSPAQRYVV